MSHKLMYCLLLSVLSLHGASDNFWQIIQRVETYIDSIYTKPIANKGAKAQLLKICENSSLTDSEKIIILRKNFPGAFQKIESGYSSKGKSPTTHFSDTDIDSIVSVDIFKLEKADIAYQQMIFQHLLTFACSECKGASQEKMKKYSAKVQNNLGVCYQNGIGTEKNPTQAFCTYPQLWTTFSVIIGGLAW